MDEVVSLHVMHEMQAGANTSMLEAFLNKKDGGSRSSVVHLTSNGAIRLVTNKFGQIFLLSTQCTHHICSIAKFKMRKKVFMRIHNELLVQCSCFIQRPDVVGLLGQLHSEDYSNHQMFILKIVGVAVD